MQSPDSREDGGAAGLEESPRVKPQPPAESATKPKSPSADEERTCGSDEVECLTGPALPPRTGTRTAANDNPAPGRGVPERRPGGKQVRMLQATLNFTDGTVEEKLKKDIQERDARIEELAERLAACENRLADHTEVRAESHNQVGELETRMQRYNEAMKALLLETARTHRRDARRWQHQQHFELGHIASLPNPVSGMTEVWIEGNTSRRLINEMNDINQRQKEIEGKKGPRSRKPTAAAAVEEDGEEAEMRKIELAALKAAEEEVRMRRLQYKQDVEAFVKELRRIHDEDASSFALRETIGPIERTQNDDLNTAAPSGIAAPQPDEAVQHSERYVLLHLLGRGGFSEVWKAFDLFEGRYVACKVHKVNRHWTQGAQRNYLKHAERELEIQRQLDHPRLMKLYDVFQFDSMTFVSVMEYSAGEDLEKRLKRCRSFREPEARLILMQVLSALRHLAEQGSPVIHYDLKPANIIFHSSLPSCLEVKVTDFGLSKVITTNPGGPSADPSMELTSQQCGTFYYLPPECFATAATITPKVDIWACGIIFFQMLYGVRPFAAEASQADIFNNKLIVQQGLRGVQFPTKPPVSNEAKDVIRRCLTYDVKKRPDIHQLCADPYFSRRNAAKRTRNSGGAMMAMPRSSESSPPTAPATALMPPPS